MAYAPLSPFFLPIYVSLEENRNRSALLEAAADLGDGPVCGDSLRW